MSNQTVTITGPRTPYEKANEAKKTVNTSENIQVFVRCRPLDVSRNEKRGVVEIDRLRREIRVNERLNSAAEKQSRLFTYDGVFDSNIGQCEVYENVVAPLIDEVLSGYNCTVFAYGQTGTGKTYTMEGERSDFECSWQDDPKAGIVPRALDQLFETLSESSGSSSQVAVSYMELYNEKLYDLLNPTDDFATLSIYEDKGGKVKIGRLAQIAVTKKEEIFEILQKGSAKRQKAETKLNSCSSRSHTIFTVTIRSKDPDALLNGEEIYRIGKLNLVDLAGSENIGRSGAVEKRAAEAGNINKSLLTLGRVITSLVERQNHIPYRESKLTRLLQDSLGGGTKTSIIATISPNILDVEDTLSTLDYAQRAKKIQNKPEVNQKVAKVDILRDVEEELIRMRKDLEAARCGTNAFIISKENYDSMTTQIQNLGKEVEEKELLVAEIEKRISQLEIEREKINSEFTETKCKLDEETQKRIETECTLEKTEQNLKTTTQDRNEQKYLVGVISETEKRLKSQANQLKEVAETSTNHVAKLHAKVERVTELHKESVSKVENKRESFSNRVKQLQLYISENFDKRELDSISSLTKNEFLNLTSLLTTISDQVDKFTASVSSGIISLTDSVNDTQVLNRMSDIITSTEHMKNFKKQCRSKLDNVVQEEKNKSNDAFDIFTVSFTQQRSSLEDMLMKLSQQLTQSSDDVKKQLYSLESVMNNILQNKSKEDESISNEVRLTEQLISEASKIRMQKITQLQELLSTMQEEDSKTSSLVLEKCCSHRNKIESSSQSLKESVKTVSEVVQEKQKMVLGTFKACTSLVNEIDNAVGLDCQSNVELASNVQSQVGNQFDSISMLIDSSETEVSSMVDKLTTSQTILLADIKSEFETKTNALALLDTSVKEQAEPLREKVVQVNQATSHSIEVIENEIYSTKLHMDSAQMNASKEFNSLSDEVKSLELKMYQPTGETPQKTNFVFPTDLAYTSPHEKILRRYRGQESSDLALAIVTQLPEGSGIFSSTESIDSCGTSSSSASNLENKIPNPKSKIAKIKDKAVKSDMNKVEKKKVLQPTN